MFFREFHQNKEKFKDKIAADRGKKEELHGLRTNPQAVSLRHLKQTQKSTPKGQEDRVVWEPGFMTGELGPISPPGV